MATSAGRRHIAPLTSLRFAAALLVVLFHFGGPLSGWLPRSLANVVAAGYVGVSFFFILSGFVLAYAYADLRLEKIGAVWSFWIGRIARVYPGYLVSIVLCAPFAIAAIASAHQVTPDVVVGSSIAVLFVPQGWFVKAFGMWNFPAWSLSVELFLYLLFPFVAGFIRNRRALPVLAVTWAIALIAPSLQVAFPALHSAAYIPLPVLHLPQFLFGVALGSRFARRPTQAEPRAAGLLATAAMLAVIVVLSQSPRIPAPLIQAGLLCPLFGTLIYAFACGGGALGAALSHRWLVKLGDASYAVYLLQAPVHDWLNRLPRFNASKSVHAGAYLLVLCGLALITHQMVERPARQWIIDWTRRPVPARAPITAGWSWWRRARPRLGTSVPAPAPSEIVVASPASRPDKTAQAPEA